MLNNGSASLDKILTMGRTEKSIMGLGYQGDSSNSQTVFVRGKSAEQNKTRVVLNDEFSGPLECIDAHRCLQTESEFSMEPAYGVGKEEVRIQDECNEFDVQQREFLQFPMTRCGIGVNKLDGTTKVSPSHDIVKLESMDKKRGYMWLIENSTHESFSFSLTDAEEEARDYAIASVICRTYIGPSHHVQKIYMRFPMTKTPQLFVGVTLLAYQASPCLGPYFAQEESVFIFLSSLLDFYWWIFSIW